MKQKQPHTKFEPTEDQRNVVSMLAAVMIPQEDIARVIINPDTKKPIALNTLKAAFPEELETGRLKVKAFTVGKLFGLIQKGVPSAIYFYLKTQCGWRETSIHELQTKGGMSLLNASAGGGATVSFYIPDNGRRVAPPEPANEPLAAPVRKGNGAGGNGTKVA